MSIFRQTSGQPWLVDDVGNIRGITSPNGSELIFPTPEADGATELTPRKVRSLVAARRVWSPAVYPAGTTNVTIVNQIPIPSAGVNGFKLVYENGTTTASTLNTSKWALAASDADNGASLTWASATFSGATSIALPVTAGTAPHNVNTPIVSDHISQYAASGYLQVRSYFSGSGCALNPGAGELAAFASATGQTFKTGFSSGAIGDTTGITLTSGQLIVPAGVVWTFSIPSATLACCGGSTLRGQGSTANAMGMIYRAAALLTTSSLHVSPYIQAQSGQNSTATMDQVVKLIDAVAPRYLVLLPGSGNDSDLTSAGFAAMKGRFAQSLDYCYRKNVIPIAATLMPSSALTAPQEALRVAQNAWLKSLGDVAVADIATVVENPANKAQLLPAYDSGDGTHLTDAGADVCGRVIANTLSNLL